MFKYCNCYNKINEEETCQMHDIVKDNYVSKYGMKAFRKSNLNIFNFIKWVDKFNKSDNHDVILYIFENKVIGFVAYFKLDNNLCVEEFQIKREYQNKFGVFRQTYNKLLELNNDFDKLMITIDKDNEEAINIAKYLGLVNNNNGWYEIEHDEIDYYKKYKNI